MRVSIYTAFSFFILITAACDYPFPPQTKVGPPDDHVVNKNGAMHREGLQYPFRPSSGCSSNQCHHEDLDGGVAVVNGMKTIAPSCFQCHGTRWKDE